MADHTNKLRRLLEEKRPSVATRILSAWPTIAEAAAATGSFDYVEFVAEYAPFSHADLENIPRALELHGVGSMIKIDFQNRHYVAQKALASGFEAILFTDHHTAAEVRESIQAIRPDTPAAGGRFGYPSRRWIGYLPDAPQMNYAGNLSAAVVAVMIEKRQAMEEIEAICAVPGVDMVQFGPSDYALSMGWNMAEHREALYEIEAEMIRVALRYGVQPRCEINRPDEAARYIALGVRHFCIGDELRNNMIYWRDIGGAMREIATGL